MGKALVIVESPAKAKTINKYLGKGYVVKSSIGHIRDLPASSSTTNKNNNIQKNKKDKLDQKFALVNQIGIDPYNEWKAHYEILPSKKKVVTELKTLAKKADHIYLATDLDREGEAIAWHLREVIGGADKRFSRVVFNEITRNAITKAFEQPLKLNLNKVNAQQTRRFMDRIVGYMISPLLWKKIARGLSAGRVQSVALRLIVERERKIKAFIPEEYWELHANLKISQIAYLTIKVSHQKKKPFKPINQQQIQAALDMLENANYVVSDRNDKLITQKPGAPFTTSTLQQSANTQLGYSVKKTMMLAQRLYEAGYITYMRTDSTNLSQDAINMVRNYIKASFGSLYLPKKSNKYSSKNNTQEAHEAIRPSDVNVLAEQLMDIEVDAKKLYQLIWRQFIACQMNPTQYDSTVLTITAGEFQLRTHSYALRFDSWTRVMPVLKKSNENQALLKVEIGQIFTLVKLIPSQHFTKPTPRYNEASLVKELEKRGIGRPSTYASIIFTIQNRGYVNTKNRRFYATKIGEIVTDRLEENFSELMSYDFTARMEDVLDQVATNQQEWKRVLDSFFQKFNQQLENAKKDPEDGGMQPNQMVMTNICCPICSRNMGIRTAISGVFLGCSGYTLSPKKRCKNTINLISELELPNMLEKNSLDNDIFLKRHICGKCSAAMDSYIIDEKHKFYICSNNPLCDGYNIEEGEFHIKDCKISVIECEKCGDNMHLKLGRFGKYMICANYTCKKTRKILKNGDLEPPKADPVPLPELLCKKSDSYFVLRDGKAGVFLAANTFPKSREIRMPLVAELVRFYDRLPEKLRYLAYAPIEDNKGNNTLVRFSRKNKQQYVSSEKDGKPTGWSAFYINGKWQVIEKKQSRLLSY
ncbi:DNA topoisomerase 1 [Candidatus Gullanella endobia]|uniref:DNA topoisomerase 1 n=1 Tax=Candidatus Gullanella endobia TaxID=1070130 RepID=A0A143WQI0_9ENTR|nr:type I DNA topoisomerase [Candidatus Gullanella endobia]CUX95970.1 DNA topoisomerase 1 [Candidatus Gullanella endobia]